MNEGIITDPDCTYLLVDGENIDATLGNGILGGVRPTPEQRPRWERVREFAQKIWGIQTKALFFLNASSGQLPGPFVQALLAMGYRPVPLSGTPDEKVVDLAVLKTLEALKDRPGNIILASHDADFATAVCNLINGKRRVAVLGFKEFMSAQYREMELKGLEIHDLEIHAKAFNVGLPRVRIIPITEFDPTIFL
ncbi:MAG: NYN domain-containing protein [Planctomycetota bacterium]